MSSFMSSTQSEATRRGAERTTFSCCTEFDRERTVMDEKLNKFPKDWSNEMRLKESLSPRAYSHRPEPDLVSINDDCRPSVRLVDYQLVEYRPISLAFNAAFRRSMVKPSSALRWNLVLDAESDGRVTRFVQIDAMKHFAPFVSELNAVMLNCIAEWIFWLRYGGDDRG